MKKQKEDVDKILLVARPHGPTMLSNYLLQPTSSAKNGERSMENISKEQFEAANQADAAQGPLVKNVRYRRTGRKIEVEYENGISISVPVALIQELQTAGNVSQADLTDVQVWAGGRSIFFPRIDISIWAPALLKGVFGTTTWMREIAREMGRVTSPAKAEAARKNGMKGGRPRRNRGSRSDDASQGEAPAASIADTHPANRAVFSRHHASDEKNR